MNAATVRMSAPVRSAGSGAPTIDVRFCDGPAGMERALAEPDRVAVIGGIAEFTAAARAVGMTGSVVGVCADEALRAAAESERRRGGLYRLRLVLDAGGALPLDDRSADAVVLARPAATARPRGRLLGEIARVLRSGGRLVVVEERPGRAPASSGGPAVAAATA